MLAATMIVLSFRIKLLLTMMLVVAGVTVAMLSATEQKVQATYEKLYQDQFETEVNFFAKQQEARLGSIKDGCEQLARSPDLRQALRGGDVAEIYRVATNELNVPTPRGRQMLGRGTTFFRILDADGAILRSPEQRVGPALQAARRRIERELATVLKSLDNVDAPLVGFLARDAGNGRKDVLDEVIVAKVADPDTQKTLGAVALGQPYLDISETNMFRMNGIKSGIWLDGHLHSETIPEEIRAEFLRLVWEQLTTNRQPQGTFTIKLAGTPQRLFFKLLNPGSPFPAAYQVSLYSLSAAVRTEQELRWQILGVASLALFVALLLILFIAHSLSIPLRELVAGTEAVRAGNFLFKVPVRSPDEVGQLAASFNEMAEGLAEKEKYRTVLNMVADERIAEQLVNGQLALGGELRDITVLFCDVRGFTTLTEGMPPEEVIEMLNEHMTALTRVVKEHNGFLDKFVGDLLMAVFGAPVATENDALNAARCALQLIRQREALNETARHKLKIGIGIATGQVVAGCMGSVDRLHYTVLGERVNLASRLSGQAGPGQVIIDQTTYDKLAGHIEARPLPGLNLKGFKENVAAYELTEVRSWSEPVVAE